MLILSSIAQMRSLAGTTLGLSDWHEITQERITAFAAATEDFEAIHLDRQAAVRQGFADVVAHGLYTLSLGPKLMGQIYEMPNFSNAVNYGYERVRFTSPVVVGCSIRLQLSMTSARQFDRGTRFLFRKTFEVAGAAKPACVADFVSVYYD
jgi:acyl dehydratase